MNDTFKKLGLHIDYPVKTITQMDFNGNGLTIVLQEYGSKAENQTFRSINLRAAKSLIENYFSSKSNKTSYEKFMQVLPIFNDLVQIVRSDLGYKYQGTNKELLKDLIDWSTDWIEENEDKHNI